MRTVRDTANHLRVSKATVYRLLKAGELSPIKVGRSTRICDESLAAFIARGGSRL